MNLYRKAINAVAGVVYKSLLTRKPTDKPDDVKLRNWLRKRGWKDKHLVRMDAKNTNAEQAETLRSLFLTLESEKR